MDIKQFTKKTEDYIYKEVAKNSNLILGKNKTASLSTGLFLKLPIVVSVEKSNKPLPKMYKELKTFMPYFSAYAKLGNTTEVFFTFLYHTEKDLDKISKELQRHGVFFAFVYMHEIQHIIRKHVTTSYNTMMTRIAGDVAFPHELINIAEDHAINYSIKDLFMISSLQPKWQEIEEIGYYNEEYHKAKMSDIDILKDMIENDNPITKEQISDALSKVTCDGKSSNQPTDPNGGTPQEGEGKDKESSGQGKADKTSTEVDDLDNSLSDLSESIQDIITSNTKGTQAGELFEQLFSSIKVDTGWFKKIKASFKRQVYYKTHDFNTSWSNLNTTYRKIYKAPKKQFIDNNLEIVLSVDHSGSVSTEALQKLLYLMEDTSKTISKLTVLIHDTRIVKEFVIEDDYDIATNPQFTQALATRFVVGGTSHSDVFNWLDNNIKYLDKSIYLSYSDNYSDIQEEWIKHPKLRKLVTYFVCTESNPMKVPGCTDITMV